MASGDTLYVFLPRAGEPPATNYPTFNSRNTIRVLEFDHTTIETIVFRGIVPSQCSGAFTVVIHWMTAATSGDVVWGASVERGTTDLDSDSFGTEVTATGTANGTSGIETQTSIDLTGNMDSIVAHDAFRLKIRRVATSGSDTVNANDAQLISVEVKET